MGARPEDLNEAMVASLESTGALVDPRVARAFRRVLRHHFLPGRPLADVYDDTAIMTKTGEGGVPVSSSSQPAIMAIMLQQLQPRPEQRVLEVGAGTGYNAALLAQLVGPEGSVVTLDYDEDLCATARTHLAAAGLERVEVRQADGAVGWPPGAPYDRLIVTASADDLSPAWFEQLSLGGRLVLPLSLAGPIQLSAAFVRGPRGFTSDSLTFCGFMPMRGAMAPSGAGPAQPREPPQWLAHPTNGRWSGCQIAGADARAGFESWLALTEPGYVRLSRHPEEAAWFGLRGESGAALLEWEGSALQLRTYGEDEPWASRLVHAHRRWLLERPSVHRLQVIALPAAQPPPEIPDTIRVIRRPRFTYFVRQP
jgi:protein-L-isoaspartate(D-aspartate) O-methyltransferase